MTSDLARNTYQKIEVNSSNGLQLVVMLYDGAIRFLGNARVSMQSNDLPGKAIAIDRALAIIGELQATLKLEEGGELAQSLDKLYSYMTQRIMEASMKLNVKPLDEVIKLLSILNSAWTEIARKPEQHGVARPTVNPDVIEQTGSKEESRPLAVFG